MDAVHNAIDMGASGIETLAVAVIVVATVHLGKALLLGLELLVAADIIRTVALAPTMLNVLILAVLVVVRTFLSWSLVVEMEGHWPWKS